MPVGDVIADYITYGDNAVTYLGTGGTLTLSATGDIFGSQFEFTAGNNKDEAKAIKVVGSFTNVAVQK